MTYSRYAIYLLPEGRWAETGAAWLGWDVRAGCAVAQPQIDGLDLPSLTARPRKYGFHATIKAPFVLADGCRAEALQAELQALCQHWRAWEVHLMMLSRLGRFFAFTAPQDNVQLQALSAEVVRRLDRYRAPQDARMLARRRRAGLSARQEAMLQQWGYPHVMEDFHFHLTLTGPVKDPERVEPLLAAYWRDTLQEPLRIRGLSLVGEAEDGMFHEISSCRLEGAENGCA